MTAPIARTKAELRAAFDRLAASSWRGARGVLAIDGGDPGPTLGVTACTHGNEPAGLAAARRIFDRLDGGWRPSRGRLVVAINNLDAAERWFGAEDDPARLATRFVDRDMNRMPADTMSSAAPEREIRRARELAPVWAAFDVALDIHSVGQDSEPMIIEGTGDARPYTKSFPITKVLRNIAAVQNGVPAFAFYGTAGRCVAFEIEAGWHEDEAAFALAVECTERLLRACAMLDGDPPPGPAWREIYDVCGALMFPNDSYVLTRVFPTFHPCRAGDILATGRGPGSGIGAALAAPIDGHIIFAPRQRIPPNIVGEVLFFTRPVRIERG